MSFPNLLANTLVTHRPLLPPQEHPLRILRTVVHLQLMYHCQAGHAYQAGQAGQAVQNQVDPCRLGEDAIARARAQPSVLACHQNQARNLRKPQDVQQARGADLIPNC